MVPNGQYFLIGDSCVSVSDVVGLTCGAFDVATTDVALAAASASATRLLLKWLRERREAEGLTMRDVGEKLHLPHSWVGKIETGERRLDVAEFVRLCRALQVDPHAGSRAKDRGKPKSD